VTSCLRGGKHTARDENGIMQTADVCDWLIEVIDLKRRAVVASRRFSTWEAPHLQNLLPTGYVINGHQDEDGERWIDILRVELVPLREAKN
jgi:hypothetical protein